jgi:predicted RNA-binding Zn-ribbon protein involved in translation (DUF1610 family)
VKALGYVLAAVLILFGLVFLLAAPDSRTAARITVGIVLLGGGIGLILAMRLRVPEKKMEITNKIDLTGDVHLEKMACRNCGAALDRTSVSLREGAIYVTCPYCNSTYQIEEEPKW